jgi:hypothetical protein
VSEQARRVAVEELANMPTEGTRNTVAGMLAVVDAQSRLKFESSAPLVQEMLESVLNVIQSEFALHDAIAPGRPGTGEWNQKVQLLDRAIAWLTKTHLKDDPMQQAREEFAKLPESMSIAPLPRRHIKGRS